MKSGEEFAAKKKTIVILCKKKGYEEYREEIDNAWHFETRQFEIALRKEKFKIKINVMEGNSDVFENTEKIGVTPIERELEYGLHKLILKRTNFADQAVMIDVHNRCEITFSHKKEKVALRQIGVFACGPQPKQVIFSPDDTKIFIPLLSGSGFEVFNMESLKMDDYVKPPDPGQNMGYAEGVFIPEKSVFMVSQMTTGLIYEYTWPGLRFLRTIDSKGKWTKFLAWSGALQVVAASNWASNDISIIEYGSGKVLKQTKTALSPRGLVFTKNGKYLYATSFDGGEIYKIDTETWESVKKIVKTSAAMRHIELSPDEKTVYVSNMYHAEIYEIDTDRFEISQTYKVDDNPNTIALSPDGNLLFVSCRGPNDPEGYLERSPRNGSLFVIQLETKTLLGTIEGGNQPTGLDVSNNGKFLCFSNFRDNTIELYWIGDLGE